MPGITSEFVSLLRCPSTGQQLRVATPEELLVLKMDHGVTALLREDGKVAYPVVGGIPSLLPEAMIILPLFPTDSRN